jgi:2-methylcitrate dehydratase PrpD
MVQSGMTAVDDVFAGMPNFFSAFAPGGSTEALLGDFDATPEILRANIKKWSVGSPIQASLDAMEHLIRDHRLRADDIERIDVEVRDDEAGIVDNRAVPGICIQHLLALMVVDGTLTFASSHDASRMADAKVLKVRERVAFKGSAALRAAGGRQAIVEVTLRGGGKLRRHVEVVRGAAGNPMSDEEVVAKATSLMLPVLGDRRVRRLTDAIWTLEDCADITTLRSSLQPTRS